MGNAIHNWEEDTGAHQPPAMNKFRTQCKDKPASRLVPETRVTDGWGMTTADLPLVKVGAAISEVV